MLQLQAFVSSLLLSATARRVSFRIDIASQSAARPAPGCFSREAGPLDLNGDASAVRAPLLGLQDSRSVLRTVAQCVKEGVGAGRWPRLRCAPSPWRR
ncbi:hypothetical protein BGZ61DRAFT_227763 [Ilyonectria robusta]|uniref:uncharacterized protein n=1 Tax=Ilyonectria robusta TaxID=1079257 RepID=UPI001E8EB906|nr:uncharacterized protein BGZ61DRAFT_227763 [Ilyonectria robusta]KAH8706817.1 hypothetical protein BGZ61DRAFT_227763 [Ilyonectria robusta]